MSIPFHKQTDPNKQAGQIVFSPPVPNTKYFGTGEITEEEWCRVATESKCACKDRFKHQCPGEWEQGCDLGANEKHVIVVEIQKNDKKL